jgi:hypothetical protein
VDEQYIVTGDEEHSGIIHVLGDTKANQILDEKIMKCCPNFRQKSSLQKL